MDDFVCIFLINLIYPLSADVDMCMAAACSLPCHALPFHALPSPAVSQLLLFKVKACAWSAMSQNLNQNWFYSPCKFTQTRNLLWQEGANNKHVRMLNQN